MVLQIKSPHSGTHIMLGDAKMEDLSTQPQTQATKQFKASGPSILISKCEPSVEVAQANKGDRRH